MIQINNCIQYTNATTLHMGIQKITKKGVQICNNPRTLDIQKGYFLHIYTGGICQLSNIAIYVILSHRHESVKLCFTLLLLILP